MVYCELGRLPLYVERQCKMVKYWTKLLNTENCILKGCYDDMFEYSCSKPNDKPNWCLIKSRNSHCLNRYQVTLIFLD